MAGADQSINHAIRLVDQAWEEVRRSPFVQQQLGAPLTSLPQVTFAEAQRRSRVGAELADRAARIDLAQLPHDLALTLRLVRYLTAIWAKAADRYWIAVDPLGVGFFGMFTTTAYCGGFLLSGIHQQLAAFRFESAGDLDRYLAVVSDYAQLVDQMSERTRGQADHGIRMPKVQVAQARALLGALRAGAPKALGVGAARAASPQRANFQRELDRRLAELVDPAFERSLAVLSDDYLASAPEGVGMSQYPGGKALYAELVKMYTTLDMTPEQVHGRGHERMTEIHEQMRAIREQLGFKGDAAAFLQHLNADPRWRASTTEGVQAVFQKYIDRMHGKFDQFFDLTPKAAHGVTPLPEALQKSMTFGYYEPARPDRNSGVYYFNSGNLTRQALFNVAALNYHELVPGHHLHLATQQENSTLHPLRTHSFVNAYNEGWAEYAATLAGEMGMYEEPEERYGRLVMDAFLTTRLVVDTGMNALGWTLEQARDYMRRHSGMAEAEILTETVRYSCDIPGQALAYKLGDTAILELRSKMRQAQGERFDIKRFHRLILEPGALPLPDLAWHIEQSLVGSA